MKRNENCVVELTDAEMVIQEWHSALLSDGYGHGQATEKMLLGTPTNGVTWRLLADMEFRKFLYGIRFMGPAAKDDHVPGDEPLPRIGFLDDNYALQYEAEVRRLGPDLYVIKGVGEMEHLVTTQEIKDDDYTAFLDEQGNPIPKQPVLTKEEIETVEALRDGSATVQPSPKELRASAGAQSCLVADMVEQGEA